MGILSLETAINAIRKKYGPTAISRGGDKRFRIGRIPTGSLSMDIETGGGWAKGKINELFGPYSSGKSYVAYLTIATNQAAYPNANFALIDFEGAFDEVWARKIGVDKSRLFIASPTYMEEGLDIADMLIKSGDMFLIVVDSWAAACPKAELEGEMSDFTVGLRARLGNKFIRKYRPTTATGLAEDEVDLGQTTLLILNQIYQGIGPYATENTPGGEQVKFGAMVRVRIRRGDLLQDKDTGAVLAQQSLFVVEKNKTFPPKRKGEFWFSVSDNADGKAGQIWRLGELLSYAASSGIIKVAGPWFYLPEAFGGEKFQGKDNLRAYVRNNPEIIPELEKLVMAEMFKGIYEQPEE